MEALDELLQSSGPGGGGGRVQGAVYRPHSTPAGEAPLPKMRPRRTSGLVDMARTSGKASSAQDGSVVTRPHAPITRRGREKSGTPGFGQASSSETGRGRRRRRRGSGDSNNRGGGQVSTQTLSLEESWSQLDHFRKVRRSLHEDEDSAGGNAGGVHFLNVESTSKGNRPGAHSHEARSEGGFDNTSTTYATDHADAASLRKNGENIDGSARQKAPIDVMSMVDRFLVEGEHDVGTSSPGTKTASTPDPVGTVPSTGFQIPELPRGRHLTINILSTWGDPYYVGLMGIEMFDNTGHRIAIANVKRQVAADPPDINVLPDYTNDPRTVDRLFDGHNHTCDDLHAWLAPFQEGGNHFIFVDTVAAGSGAGEDPPSECCLSMMRIWNYNKSRIHSFRGARYVEIKLDDHFIFKGEIRRAPGAMLGSSACSECILFTMNANILRIIERYDNTPEFRDSMATRGRTLIGWGDTPPGTAGRQQEEDQRHFQQFQQLQRKYQQADWTQGWGGGNMDDTPGAFFEARELERPQTAGERRSRGVDEGREGLECTRAAASSMPVKTPPDEFASARPLTAAGRDTNTNNADDDRPMKRDSGANALTSPSSASSSSSPSSHPTLAIVGRHLGAASNIGPIGLSRSASNATLQGPEMHNRQNRSQNKQSGSARLYRVRCGSGGKKPLRPKTAPLNRDGNAVQPHVGQVLTMTVLSNWGDPDTVGLTGIQVLDKMSHAVPITAEMFTCTPSWPWNVQQHPGATRADIMSFHDHERALDPLPRLFDEETSNSSDRNDMWLAPYPGRYTLRVDFRRLVNIIGLVVWNYNAGGVDDTYRGVRLMEIALDGVTKSPVTGCLIRKAPGSSSFNFGQFVSLTAGSSGAMAPRQKQMQRREREEQEETARQAYPQSSLMTPEPVRRLRAKIARQKRPSSKLWKQRSTEKNTSTTATMGLAEAEDLSAGGFITEDTSQVSSEHRWAQESASSRHNTSSRPGTIEAVGDTSDWGWSRAGVTGSFARSSRNSDSGHERQSRGSHFEEEQDGQVPVGGEGQGGFQNVSRDLKSTRIMQSEVDNDALDEPFRQQYETPLFPTGCIFKFVLQKTHGDPHYIGLNGLELYDENNCLIPLDETVIEAVPRDINELPFVIQSGAQDVRTLDKLYDGVNTAYTDGNMWLAPFAPFSGNTDRSNCIYVFLDDPVSISRVVVYNYTKTPSRGVSEIEMLVDDVLVYRGTLRKAQSEVEARRDQNKSNGDDGGRSNSNPGGGKIQCPNNANAILFTADKQVIRQALQRGHVFNPSEDDDDSHCLFFNHGQQIQDASAAGHAMRPTTSARSTRRVGRGVHKSIQDNVGDLKTTKSKRLQPL